MTVKHEVDAIIHTMDYIVTAAKVAKLDVYHNGHCYWKGDHRWDPLSSNNDAFELMIALEMCITVPMESNNFTCTCELAYTSEYVEQEYTVDVNYTTRLAICKLAHILGAEHRLKHSILDYTSQLYLTAKACNFEIHNYIDEKSYLTVSDNTGNQFIWNPLINLSDAFKLIDKFGLCVDSSSTDEIVVAWFNGEKEEFVKLPKSSADNCQTEIAKAIVEMCAIIGLKYSK